MPTPDEALNQLLAGNERYATGQSIASNTPEAREALAAGQSPFAVVIRCADSRVSPEIVFDQPLGELFVCAVAGNIITPEITASAEYAVAVLGAPLIVIMGHTSCGAVHAAIEHRNDTSALPGNLPQLVDQVLERCGEMMDSEDPDILYNAVVGNANAGIEKLLQSSSVISEQSDEGRVKIIAGIQDIETGTFTITSQ